MISNAARLLMVSAAASLVALGPAPAQACSDISDGALDIIDAVLNDPNHPPVSVGAGLFTLTQKNVFSLVDADIFNLWGKNSPSSLDYYAKFVAGTNVTQITNASSIAAGDVLVVGRGTTGSYSGHTVIITDVALELNTMANPALNPKYTNTKQWALPIADSTNSVHGCNATYPDSRWTGTCAGGTFTPGTGTAFMRIYSDLSGNLSGLSGTLVGGSGTLTGQGHTWSVTSGAPVYEPTTRPYVIGRVTPCPLP
ncbi:hypothetical protein WME75_12965 [Sorangium sp. So ce1014]|uniref:hypothetical protein n=1 Tax=Sorangium sp. So ce1014 TaxID=3133326 RepID=UPI003F61DE60